MAQHRQQFALPTPSDQVGIRIPSKIQTRIRRPIRPEKPRRRPSAIAVFSITLSVGLLVTFFAFHRLSDHKENEESEFSFGQNRTVLEKKLKFGHGSGATGRDLRYWDRDDRRRDQDYKESDVEQKTKQNNHEHERRSRRETEERSNEGKGRNSGGLYNEGGMAELESYKEEYENSLKRGNSEDDEYDDDGTNSPDDGEEEEKSRKDVTLGVKEKGSSEVVRNSGGITKGGARVLVLQKRQD